MIENYITYLNFLEGKLSKFFEKQKPYIFCKKGCGKCCKNSQFPYSLMEVNYLISGLFLLPEEIQDEVAKNVEQVLKAKAEFKGEKFRYDCPFLINNECVVYDYRGIVCRAFGLMTQDVDKTKKIKVPFCCYEGLNYSNVMDFELNKVSDEKFEQLGVKEEPTAFNISYEFLTDPDFERGFNFQFGDKKPLIEWFENPSENEQEENSLDS